MNIEFFESSRNQSGKNSCADGDRHNRDDRNDQPG